jgi:hypothetical protein
MKEQEKKGAGKIDDDDEQNDELGKDQPIGGEVNKAIEQQGKDAAAGIPRDSDAARHEQEPENTGNDDPH